ncbi:ABC transporter ATP-binding protein [Aurantimonas sp. VKM B-3413]|uniref:ABC transporter ATP-binding protein n=1 Tax=Aurantimonas sp. VKM B-3413 TaxID=2779401 RepID=UPI001E446831|nr:ABC transporter ATP-binding protein [Aurantimonas sp. VKM B-3413]MCB8839891.1 ABC transporter ATP-binding protein [Aurantimonas sp. VKM B-3413]
MAAMDVEVGRSVEDARDRSLSGCGPVRIPEDLSGIIWRCGFWEQFWLVLLSVSVFVVNIAPLELQRQIVNDAVNGNDMVRVFWLAGLYALTTLLLGVLKLGMNVYRGKVSENAVRWLRGAILTAIRRFGVRNARPIPPGIEVSLVLSEVEPIGSFVGISLSAPLLQGGILVSTFAYLTYIEPMMALVALVVLSPQVVFVPLMQKAINRRVGRRVTTLRSLSAEIIDEPADDATATLTYGREIDAVFRLNMGIFKIKYSMNFLMNLMYHFGVASVLALGGYYVIEGMTEIGTIVAFISGLSQINAPWGDVVDWYREWRVTQTKYGMITKVLAVLNTAGPTPAVAGAAAAEAG